MQESQDTGFEICDSEMSYNIWSVLHTVTCMRHYSKNKGYSMSNAISFPIFS